MRTLLLAIGVLCLVCTAYCAGAIVEYPEQKELNKDQIKAALRGDDFRSKNAARDQLEKLEPAERLGLLTALLQEKDAPTRLLAVAELTKLPRETWEPILKDLAANDPDETVQDFAKAALGMEDEGETGDEEEGTEEEGDLD